MQVHFLTNKNTKGFALLLSIILASVVLAIGLSILRISVSQLQLSATARESELSLHAAQSLNECLSYWRRKEADAFMDDSFPSIIENIECMGVTPYSDSHNPVGPQTHELVTPDSTGHADDMIIKHYYTFEWPNPAGGDDFCSDGELYFMLPYQGNPALSIPASIITHNFEYTSVGPDGDGTKICDASRCGVLITRGYNRPCDKLQDSIFTVQRELTFEF